MSQEERADLKLLYQASREFASALELKTVLTRVLFAALNNVGGERASIVVMDDNGRAVDSAIVYGNQVRENTITQLRETIERGLAGWVVRQKEAVLVPDTSKDPRWLRREDDAQDRSGAKSAMCVPLMARQKVVGVLTLVHPVVGSYNEDHFRLMCAIADQAGIAILNARLFTESQRQARVMTVLAEGSANMSLSVRLEDIFASILAQTIKALQVETACLGLVQAEQVVFRAAEGLGGAEMLGRGVRLGDGIAGLVAREGRGAVIPAIASDTLLAQAEKPAGMRVRALACAPIYAHGKVIGILQAFNPTNKVFDPDSLLVLTGLGSLAGTAIQNGQLFQSLDVARRRYSDLFEDSIDPIVLTDRAGYILEVNRRAAQFSGHSPQSLRRFKIDHMHDINYEKTGQVYEKIGDTALTYESTLYTAEGLTSPVEVHVRKVMLDDAESFQWILRDIRERKELDSLREDLAAMIYHDLRSPLANILSSVEMLAAFIPATEKENSQPILQIARHSIDRIQRLITSLLDLNRLEQNQPIGERQTVSVTNLVEETLQVIAPAREGRNQTLETRLDPNLPPVLIDADMVRRVLINLAENAVKYTPANGHILIAAQQQGDFVQISVEDNGTGIPEADRERVFDKFTRLKNKTGARGLGVGLAFCKLAILGHGGRIWVEPAETQGSKFVFTLPAAQP